MEQIAKWFADPKRSYDEGVALLKKHFSNRHILSTLERKARPMPILWEILEHNLKKVSTPKELPAQRTVTVPELKPIELKPTKSAKPKLADNPYVDVSSLPADLQAVYRRNMDIYRICDDIHSKMKSAKTDKERQPLAEELVKLEDEQLEGWKKIDAYVEANGGTKGPIPEKEIPAPPKVDIIALAKREKVVKDNITRSKNKLKSAEPGTTAHRRAKESLEKFEDELRQIKKTLKDAQSASL